MKVLFLEKVRKYNFFLYQTKLFFTTPKTKFCYPSKKVFTIFLGAVLYDEFIFNAVYLNAKNLGFTVRVLTHSLSLLISAFLLPIFQPNLAA